MKIFRFQRILIGLASINSRMSYWWTRTFIFPKLFPCVAFYKYPWHDWTDKTHHMNLYTSRGSTCTLANCADHVFMLSLHRSALFTTSTLRVMQVLPLTYGFQNMFMVGALLWWRYYWLRSVLHLVRGITIANPGTWYHSDESDGWPVIFVQS